MELAFQKEKDNKWYVILPDYPGDHEDLEMVSGADDLLESLARVLHRTNITFQIWLSKPDVPAGNLTKISQDAAGATYQVNNCMYYKNTAWLCNVTQYVFGGYHPDSIYFKVI